MKSFEQQPNLEQDPTLELVEKLKLEEQYYDQLKTLSELGVLENFRNLDKKDSILEMGIVGIDGKEYIIPSYEQILDTLKNNPEQREIMEKKAEQGFTRMFLIPFAMPISVLLERYKELLLKTHKESGLKSTDGTILELDQDNPIHIWEDLIQSDNPQTPEDKQMEYGVKSYDSKTKEERGGKYKSELLENPNNAWQVVFIEDMSDIPAEGQGQIKGGRKQFEANKSSKEYSKLLQQDPQYQNEEGQTLEATLILYADNLLRGQTVTDDWQGKGKANRMVGSLVSGDVPNSYWFRGDHRSFFYGRDPGNRSSGFGFRSLARLKIDNIDL